MAEAKTNAFEPSAAHPGAREMSVPEGVSLGDLTAKSMSMAPRSGTPTPQVPTTESTPTGPSGINELPAAPVMGISPTPRSALASAGPAPASPGLQVAKTQAEAAKGAMGANGPNVGYQGTGDRR
jgi:hypothetical protein